MPQLFAAMFLMVTAVCLGWAADPAREQITGEVAQRVRSLNGQFAQLLTPTTREQQLRAACKVNCSIAEVQQGLNDEDAKRMAALDAVASQIHAEIDRYVTHIIGPEKAELDRAPLERSLTQILAPVTDNPPRAFVLDSSAGRSLIVVYTLHKGLRMGSDGTSVTLRAYKALGGRLELANLAGEDMDGYTDVSVKALHSPVPGEEWLLLWGQMSGANGPNMRLRAYAYNGAKFRTTWMPANFWGALTVNVTAAGFTLDGSSYRDGRKRHETYKVAPDGLYVEFPRN